MHCSRRRTLGIPRVSVRATFDSAPGQNFRHRRGSGRQREKDLTSSIQK